MHKQYDYTSVFSKYISDYIQIHREAGYEYDNPAYWLYRFDQFCTKHSICEAIITKSLYDEWSIKSSKESKVTQTNRLQAVRGLSIYLNSLGIQSYIPINLPKPEKVVPYLMTDSDIREFFEQVDLYETTTTVKAFQRLAVEYKILFRIIYCCGLRNNEACTLKIQSLNLTKGLFILNHTKGNKERIVYLPDDLKLLCEEYIDWLYKNLNSNHVEWLFPGKDPHTHILKTSVDRKFNEFWNKTSLSQNSDKKPTVHCLRHAFVIKRVNLWMENNLSLQVMMPYLSSYLGHKGPIETYYYYHQVEDVFKTVRGKDITSSLVIPEVAYEE